MEGWFTVDNQPRSANDLVTRLNSYPIYRTRMAVSPDSWNRNGRLLHSNPNVLLTQSEPQVFESRGSFRQRGENSWKRSLAELTRNHSTSFHQPASPVRPFLLNHEPLFPSRLHPMEHPGSVFGDMGRPAGLWIDKFPDKIDKNIVPWERVRRLYPQGPCRLSQQIRINNPGGRSRMMSPAGAGW